MTIGVIAKKLEISTGAIRFYEQKGLIERPVRSDSGYRQYTDEVIIEINFIKRGQHLGFSLKEIKELIKLDRAPHAPCDKFKEYACNKIIEIDLKLSVLRSKKKALKNITRACSTAYKNRDCGVWKSLVNGAEDI